MIKKNKKGIEIYQEMIESLLMAKNKCLWKCLNSVNRVIEGRRKLPVCNQKVSVITFNQTAEIEHLNVRLRETINIKNKPEGGTSFVKLLKLENVLKPN